MRIKTYEDGHWRIKPDKDEDLLAIQRSPAMQAVRQILDVIDRLPDEQRINGRKEMAAITEDLLSYPQLFVDNEVEHYAKDHD